MPSDPQCPTRLSRLPSRGFGLARVTGRSMLPTLTAGDLLLVRWGARPRSGALVVVRLPEGRPISVKRAAGRRDGGWWVERDSALEGVDSWTFGALPDAAVLAVVLARVWPRPRPLAARTR